MSYLTLTDSETRLVSSIERAEVFKCSDGEVVALSAKALYCFFAGLPVKMLHEAEPRPVRLPQIGLQLDGVTITGTIVLDELAGVDGSPLPPLILTKCLTNDTVSLCRAHFRAVSLSGSRLPHLRAIGLHVAGRCDLSAISSSEDDDYATGLNGYGRCWVELREAVIHGSLIASSARLVAPAKRLNFPATEDRAEYALDICNITVEGELLLSPDFEALGGVNINSARVDRDIVLIGATLVAGEEYALSANRLNAHGAVLAHVGVYNSEIKPLIANGAVAFLDATVMRSLDFRGALVRGFRARNARIDGAALLGTWESKAKLFPFRASDGVSLEAAKIACSLVMSGAKIKSLDAQNARIGGILRLCAYDGTEMSVSCIVDENISLFSADVQGSLDLSGASIGTLVVQNSRIWGSVYMRVWEGRHVIFRFIASGEIIMIGSKISGSINARGASMIALNANNSHIDGAVFLREWHSDQDVIPFSVQRDLSLMGSKIAGNLEMAGATVRNIFAAGAEIGGALLLTWDRPGTKVPFQAQGSVSLVGATIAGNLEMNGASVKSFEAQNADIGGSVFLRALKDIKSNTKHKFRSHGDLFMIGIKIRADLDLSGATLNGKLSAQNATIGGNVWMQFEAGLPFRTCADIDLSSSKINKNLIVAPIETARDANITIDLSHASVEVLDDQDGSAWGDNIIMKLEGFSYIRLATNRPSEAQFKNKARTRKDQSASLTRLKWLNLQYRPPYRQPDLRNYSPDVYDRLARAFRANGYFVDASMITSEKLRVERRISETRPARPVLWLYAYLFDSGLSPRLAITTFATFILLGYFAAKIADEGIPSIGYPPVLVLETSTVNSLAVRSADATSSRLLPGLLIGETRTTATDEIPCGQEIVPLLYALDVFVPALELHQEHRCRITTAPAGFYWRIARAAYALIGWIVTALTVLTASGVARRHLEG